MARHRPEEDDSTTSGLPDQPMGMGRWTRRLGVLMLVVIVTLAATSMLGPREDTVRVSSGTWHLEVVHAQLTRAGEPAPLHLRITSDTGFGDQPVQVEICGDLFDQFDFQNWYPNPSAEVGEGETMAYEFDPPSGDYLEVSLDARTSPALLGSHDSCTVTVLEQDRPVVEAELEMWRLP